MAEFMKRKMLGVCYTENDNSGLALQEIGYNNFKFFKPVTIPRMQDMFTLHFVLEGSGVLNIYGKQYNIRQNDMFFIPPNEPMSYYPNHDDLWKYVWIAFSGKNAELYGTLMGFDKNSPAKTSRHCHDVYKIICDVFAKLNNSESIGYYTALAMFYNILGAETKKIEFSEDAIFAQIDTYITSHFHNPELKIEKICQDLNISHSYLCKIYKENIGITVKKKLLNLRIDEAKRLLLNTNLGIASVAYSVGFSDNIHFMKTFKKYTGMTASEYRKQT